MDEFVKYLKSYICEDEDKSDAISTIMENQDISEDEWICDLVQCADLCKYPRLKHKKLSECDVVSESCNPDFLKM